MSPLLVALCYGSATLISLFLLWYFGPTRWYWHVLSFAGALFIGFIPGDAFWSQPSMTLLTGWFFVVLLIWGVAAPAFTGERSFAAYRPEAPLTEAVALIPSGCSFLTE